MARFHFYIQPFNTLKQYSGTWTEVTNDIDMAGAGKLKQALDNTEYDVGVFRNSNVAFKLRNDHGDYSDADSINSIFKWKRSESKFRITWEPGDKDLVCGFFNAGDPDSILTSESTIFEGLLSDEATKEGMNDQIINFVAMGYESIFKKVAVPFSSLSVGDTFEEVLYTILNQTAITDLVTVSTLNINVGNDETTDAVADLENNTVLQALKKILLPSNSVLYINGDNEVIISERTVGSSTAHTFYGPGSNTGIENILKINEYRLGINRVINYWTFKKTDDTTRLKQDATSVGNNGVRKKEIECKLIDDASNAKIDTMLETLRDEFATKKIELVLTCPYDQNTFELFLLNKILIDYPSHALPSEGLPIGIYDVSDPATDYYYAHELFNLTIDIGVVWKVLERSINIREQTLTLKLREV
jgi:hypothetical protein